MSTIQDIHQGKYGYYPCDKETYRLLRKVRYYNHVNLHQTVALERWSRKLPKNRVRWKFDGFHAANAPGISYTKWVAEPWEKPKVCPVNLHLLWSEYRKAAKGVNKIEDVQRLSLSKETIQQLVNGAEEWLTSIGKEKR